LNAAVQRWRSADQQRMVPWFDPADGGVDAQVMLLLEAPGPRTMLTTGSGICSEDNPDPSNTLIRARREAAGLERSACVKWNAVPWPVTAPPRSAEVAEAAARLRQVVDLLPRLRLVITFGTTALSVVGMASTLTDPPMALPVLAVPHPSQRNTHARHEALARMDRALTFAAETVSQPR